MRERKPILLLPDPLIDQIAAGEVIERPASVLKELLENSLDGGAKRIEVDLENGGIDLIQVIDDGMGISEEDLPLSVVAHATSKIQCSDDLQKILTRGFRGEALASMGAVGELEIASRAETADEAFQIQVKAGQSSALKPVALAKGTRVSLRHLFRQLPARRKFLKSAKAEANRCMEVLLKMALTQYQTHFILRVDGRVRADWPAVLSLELRAAKILKVSHLRQGKASRPGVEVTMFVAAPEYARQTRTGQYFFLMGRYIRDRALSQVVWQSSREFIPDNRHPMLLVTIDMDPSRVDVNVHPTKEEVRFEEPRRIAALMGEALRDAMADAEYAPEMNVAAALEVRESKLPRAQRPVAENWAAPDHLGWSEAAEKPQEGLKAVRKAMQLHNAYILAETDEGLSILDQHALHERILLQKLKKELLSGQVEQQTLLIPHLVELTPAEATVLLDIADDLKQVGFDIEDHGDGVLAISALPVAMKTQSLDSALMDVLERADGLSDPESIRLAIARICACRSAVKAGDILKQGEIEALLRDHNQEDFSFACEHGRPTHVKISLAQLSRGFERH
jgi:DNA mismatch repair protein MutL